MSTTTPKLPTLTAYAKECIVKYAATGWRELGGVILSDDGLLNLRVDFIFDITGEFTGAELAPITAEQAVRVQKSFELKQAAIARGEVQAAVIFV